MSMARAIWSGYLTFGLVSVPVGLYTATADQTIHFHQLHKGTSNRIRYRRVDEVTGDEVPLSDIVSGYDLGGGEYVVVTRDELREVAPGRSEQIEISDFVDLERIDPVYFRQTYYLAPRGKAADRAYALLRQAMRETSKVGIATLILRDKEHLVAVRPGDEVLILETMYFDDEIRKPSEEIGNLPGETQFEGRELTVAKKLVESLTVDWSPDEYRNTYRARVEELLESKRAGGGTVTPSEERPKTNVVDLMTALEESIARARGQSAPARGAAATRPAAPRKDAGFAELAALSRAELLDLAARQSIPGRSKLSKAALIEALAPAAAPKRGRRKTSLGAGRASRDLSWPGDKAVGEEAPDARASNGYRGLLRLRAGPGALPRHRPRAPGRRRRVHRRPGLLPRPRRARLRGPVRGRGLPVRPARARRLAAARLSLTVCPLRPGQAQPVSFRGEAGLSPSSLRRSGSWRTARLPRSGTGGLAGSGPGRTTTPGDSRSPAR
jgi:DNA end-binding protein Ku